jgi:2-iminobutanoate/2-iminopropanoate deaminase
MKSIISENAPAPIGPYSQAMEVNGFIYTSGQIALDPKSGEIVSEAVDAQVHQVIKNLQAVLNAAGSGLDKVVKTTIFLANMADFRKVNEVYASYFNESKPARSTVEVSCLPKNVLVEIDCIAVK